MGHVILYLNHHDNVMHALKEKKQCYQLVRNIPGEKHVFGAHRWRSGHH